MRCTIGVPDFFEDLNVADWNKEMARPLNKQMYLFANIYHAKNLIPADDDGSSDPYYSIEYYGCEEVSPVIQDTLNPVSLIFLITRDFYFFNNLNIKIGEDLV
jgi:hypothetical protein